MFSLHRSRCYFYVTFCSFHCYTHLNFLVKYFETELYTINVLFELQNKNKIKYGSKYYIILSNGGNHKI